MKIALVFPGIADVGFNSAGDGIDGSWHSHGLMTLSACLKSSTFAAAVGGTGGHETVLVDLRKLTGWDDYRSSLKNINPDAIMITMMSCDFNPAVEAARVAREALPGVHISVGGAHPSISPDEVLACPEFDTVVLKEGEIAVVRIMAMLQAGQKPPHKMEGEAVELDLIPFSDRTLFGPYEVPISMPDFQQPFMTFIAGRGCKYNCSFCQPAERMIFGRKVRRRSPENFVAELQECYDRHHFRSALIHDDCLIEDSGWISRFVELVAKSGMQISFACQGRADIICRNPEMIASLKSIGLKGMIVGFESGSNRVLKFIRKGATREQNIQAGEVLRGLGVHIWANYMFGLPTETMEEMLETISMLKIIKPDHYSPAVFTPHPGSDLFDYCLRENLMLRLTHDSFRRNVTEAKIKGQDWHVIQWAVGESIKAEGDCIPYSKDYISHWGDLENLLTAGSSEMSFLFHKGMSLTPTSYENLVPEGTAGMLRSTSTDPQVVYDLPNLARPGQWRYLFVDIETSASSRGQFIWWTEGLQKFQATRHFRIPFGRHTFVFDLNRLKTYQTQIGDGISWNDLPVTRLRFDPAESHNITLQVHRIWLLPQ